MKWIKQIVRGLFGSSNRQPAKKSSQQLMRKATVLKSSEMRKIVGGKGYRNSRWQNNSCGGIVPQ